MSVSSRAMNVFLEFVQERTKQHQLSTVYTRWQPLTGAASRLRSLALQLHLLHVCVQSRSGDLSA